MKIIQGYQMIFGQFNKAQNFKIYYAAKQILHKAGVFIYLEKIENLIQGSILKEVDAIRIFNEEENHSATEIVKKKKIDVKN